MSCVQRRTGKQVDGGRADPERRGAGPGGAPGRRRQSGAARDSGGCVGVRARPAADAWEIVRKLVRDVGAGAPPRVTGSPPPSSCTASSVVVRETPRSVGQGPGRRQARPGRDHAVQDGPADAGVDLLLQAASAPAVDPDQEARWAS